MLDSQMKKHVMTNFLHCAPAECLHQCSGLPASSGCMIRAHFWPCLPPASPPLFARMCSSPSWKQRKRPCPALVAPAQVLTRPMAPCGHSEPNHIRKTFNQRRMFSTHYELISALSATVKFNTHWVMFWPVLSLLIAKHKPPDNETHEAIIQGGKRHTQHGANSYKIEIWTSDAA